MCGAGREPGGLGVLGLKQRVSSRMHARLAFPLMNDHHSIKEVRACMRRAQHTIILDQHSICMHTWQVDEAFILESPPLGLTAARLVSQTLTRTVGGAVSRTVGLVGAAWARGGAGGAAAGEAAGGGGGDAGAAESAEAAEVVAEEGEAAATDDAGSSRFFSLSRFGRG